MKWKSKLQHNEPKIGDERICRQFLLLPKKINNQTRWLERATWLERYKIKLVFIPAINKLGFQRVWNKEKWID